MFNQLSRVFTALIALSLVASVAHADRRTSLGGNMLMGDRDDVFVYPQLMVKKAYNRTLSMDFGANADVGNALLIAGPNKKSAIGVALHRSDSILSLGGGSYNGSPEFGMTSNNIAPVLYQDGSTTTPLNIADLMYAMKMGKNKLGFRLGFVGQGNSQTNDGDHVAGENVFGLRLSAGYSVGKKGDFVFDFSMLNGSKTSGKDEDVNSDASFINVHVGGRYFLSQQKGFKLGTLFDINYASLGNTNYPQMGDDTAASNDIFGLQAGFGPVYTGKVNDKKYTVAFHAHFGFRTINEEPNDQEKDDEASSSNIMFPGFNMAMEYQVLSWLAFRSGANYSYVISNSLTTTPGGDDAVENASGEAGFGWNAGLGFLMDSFRIDGTLSHGILTGGPQFLGGNANGLFGLVSATGKF